VERFKVIMVVDLVKSAANAAQIFGGKLEFSPV